MIQMIVSLISFAISLYGNISWAIVTTKYPVYWPNRVKIFLNYYPKFIQSVTTIANITFIASIIAIVFSLMWMYKASGANKIFAMVVFIVSILIAIFPPFHRM